MPIFAVNYTYPAGSLSARDEHLAEHRRFLDSETSAGRLVMRGPFAEQDGPGALLVWSVESRAELETLLTQDPFALRGLVVGCEIREWIVPALAGLLQHR